MAERCKGEFMSESGRKLNYKPASEFQPRVYEYLWEPYLPKHECSFLTGFCGDGKNLLSSGIAACVTNGTPLPEETHRECGHVLIINTDRRETAFKGNLFRCGADMNRIHVMDYDGKPAKPLLTKDLQEIKEQVDIWHPQLIIMEAWRYYYGKRIYFHSESGFRDTERYLNKVATDLDCHLMLLLHDVKQPHKAFPWVAKNAFRVMRAYDAYDSTTRILLPVGRRNYETHKTQKFSCTGGKVTWLGESPITADDYFYSESHKRTASNVVEAMKLRLANKR